MLFQIKSKPEDFIVEEILPNWFPSWEWDFLYVFFEKENLTTMDIIDYLTKNLHLQRDELGIAWLKDKAWITRQWISISKRSLSALWWEDLFIQTLWEKVRILKKSWNESWLKVASNDWNKFKIRLRARQEFSDEIKNHIENNVQKIRERWFPNCFWMQRFGKWKKNFYEAKDRLKALAEEYEKKWKLVESDLPYHLRFLLQAYPSMYFNEYVLKRWEKGLFLLQWDILVDRFNSNWVKTAVYDSQNVCLFDYQKFKKEKSDLNFFEPEIEWGLVEPYSDKRLSTGPMLWWNLLLPWMWTKARVRDDQLLSLAEFDEWIQQVCKIYNLRWIRRVLFIRVPDLKFEWESNDINLEFSLPTGSYATTLVSFILQWIDHLTLKDNSLLIPKISEK
jgi:tRNA(Glu) U13 pseudouridine synthase TruD